jgi:hypothetical protein
MRDAEVLEEIAESLVLAQRQPTLPSMLCPVVQHVAALAERL